jgi:hypothetical protein
MKRDNEFLHLTRHLKKSDINLQIDVASHLTAAEVAEVLRAYAFIRDIANAAVKYRKELQEEFHLTDKQMDACIQIKQAFEKVELETAPGLFRARVPFDMAQLKKIFTVLAGKHLPKKSPH